jgi:hypothetical protein
MSFLVVGSPYREWVSMPPPQSIVNPLALMNSWYTHRLSPRLGYPRAPLNEYTVGPSLRELFRRTRPAREQDSQGHQTSGGQRTR